MINPVRLPAKRDRADLYSHQQGVQVLILIHYYPFCWHSFCVYDKQLDQKQPGKERVSFILHFQVIVPHGGKFGQALKARTEETTVHRLVYTTQDISQWARPSLIKQIPTDKHMGHCGGGNSSSEVPFSHSL